MLIALLTAMYLLLGGTTGHAGALTTATVKEMGKQVEVAVTDPVRAEAASDTLKELRGEIKAFEKKFSKSTKSLTKLYKDHDANADRVLAVLDELNSDWLASQERAIDLRFDLKESLTREEWEDVFGGE